MDGRRAGARTDWCVPLDECHVAELLPTAARRRRLADDPSVSRFPLPTLGPVLSAASTSWSTAAASSCCGASPSRSWTTSSWPCVLGHRQHLGIPIPQNDAGDLLVHVRDQGLDFADPEVRAYQTAARLDYHSDSSDIVGLLCVRPSPVGGVSTIVSSAAVRNAALDRRPDLAPELLGTWWWDRRKPDLATSFFQRRIFATVDDGRGRSVSYHGRAHIESATRGRRSRRSRPAGRGPRPARRTGQRPGFVLNMDFRPGDVQFLVDYAAVWHARTAYEDHPEPERHRGLLRLWLTLRAPLELPADFRTGGDHPRERRPSGDPANRCGEPIAFNDLVAARRRCPSPTRPFLRVRGTVGRRSAEWTVRRVRRRVVRRVARFLREGGRAGRSDAVHLALVNSPTFVAVWLAAVNPSGPGSCRRTRWEPSPSWRVTSSAPIPVVGFCSTARADRTYHAAVVSLPYVPVSVVEIDEADGDLAVVRRWRARPTAPRPRTCAIGPW